MDAVFQESCPQLALPYDSFRKVLRESERLAFEHLGNQAFEPIKRRDPFRVGQAIAETEVARMALVEHAAAHGCGEVTTMFPHADGATEAVFIYRAAPVVHPLPTYVASRAESR